MADIDLPVFTFLPNWRQGITETLEWKTDVMRSEISGHEQRRAIRLTPRRFFEATFNPLDQARSFMDLWLHSFGAQEFLLPLWHDRAKLTAGAGSGTARLDFDNTYREFETGGLALLRTGLFSYEVVEIDGQDDDGLDLAANLGQTWQSGTTVYPLRPAYLDDAQATLAAITRNVGESKIAFRLSRNNPYDAGAETLTLYSGYPVVTVEPNRADDLTVRYEQMFEDADFDIGRVYRRSEAGRSFPAQFYNWQARGRQQHHELRQALYRLNGRQKAVWMPSFNKDVVLTRNLGAASANLDIQKIGYGYLGGPISGREYITLLDDTGTRRIVQVTNTGNPADPDTEERLVLSGAAGFAAAAGREGSFLDLVRLDQDTVEITHYTDSDGVCEVTAAFKSFKNGRDPSGTLILPYPIAVKTVDSCGSPAEDEESGCLAIFSGWYAKMRVTWINASTPRPGNGYYANPNVGPTIFHTDGPPDDYSLYVAYDYIEFVWTSPSIEDATEMDLRLQFQSGSVDSAMRATASFQRWDGAASVLSPKAGSWSTGTVFDVRGLWPDNWYFDI